MFRSAVTAMLISATVLSVIPHALIVACKGDDISATLDGKPTDVAAKGKPRLGRFNIKSINAQVRVTTIEFLALSDK